MVGLIAGTGTRVSLWLTGFGLCHCGRTWKSQLYVRQVVEDSSLSQVDQRMTSADSLAWLRHLKSVIIGVGHVLSNIRVAKERVLLRYLVLEHVTHLSLLGRAGRREGP